MKIKEERLITIRCPFCGAQYLPAEIYLPDAFLGKPSIIDKTTDTSTIIDFEGKSMDLNETYQCDKCNTTFNVCAKVQFNTYIDEKKNFTTEHKTNIKRKVILFNEE